ncbi:hypothetical protein TSAR_016367 [Trichomalopsis sarcophagae]|uniref:Uncharacterized protein n=1 Tax=Trichomalopsis sarcophagae TaxID=543379 RepID=A0A232FAJ1_9HYME|nr:hypothetical protein TSAR_016367 [Trichomalopsis sarcophagae]
MLVAAPLSSAARCTEVRHSCYQNGRLLSGPASAREFLAPVIVTRLRVSVIEFASAKQESISVASLPVESEKAPKLFPPIIRDCNNRRCRNMSCPSGDVTMAINGYGVVVSQWRINSR